MTFRITGNATIFGENVYDKNVYVGGQFGFMYVKMMFKLEP